MSMADCKAGDQCQATKMEICTCVRVCVRVCVCVCVWLVKRDKTVNVPNNDKSFEIQFQTQLHAISNNVLGKWQIKGEIRIASHSEVHAYPVTQAYLNSEYRTIPAIPMLPILLLTTMRDSELDVIKNWSICFHIFLDLATLPLQHCLWLMLPPH